MTEIVFYVALVWMLVLLLATVVIVIRGDGTLTRVLGLDALSLILTAVLILYSTTTGRSWILCMPRMPDCGGFRIGLDISEP